MGDAAKRAQLRQLMKQQADPSASVGKIESPLAKYTDKGDLICILCKVPVKSNALWTSHCNSAPHKQNLLILAKKKQQQSSLVTVNRPRDDEESENEPPAKRRKIDDDDSANLSLKEHQTSPENDQNAAQLPNHGAEQIEADAEALKQLRREWDLLEEAIQAGSTNDAANSHIDNDEDLEMNENNSSEDEGDFEEYIELQDDRISKPNQNRLTFLQQQKSALEPQMNNQDKTKATKDQEESEESEEESDEEVDLEALYDWRAKAI